VTTPPAHVYIGPFGNKRRPDTAILGTRRCYVQVRAVRNEGIPESYVERNRGPGHDSTDCSLRSPAGTSHRGHIVPSARERHCRRTTDCRGLRQRRAIDGMLSCRLERTTLVNYGDSNGLGPSCAACLMEEVRDGWLDMENTGRHAIRVQGAFLIVALIVHGAPRRGRRS